MVDFNGFKSIYFIGLKGVMMSNLAIYFQSQGIIVSGSDTSEDQITSANLEANKILVLEIHSPLPKGVDLVVYGAAHGGAEAKEVREAIGKNIACITQAELIVEIIKKYLISIAVSGCHGKTGTSSLLAYTLINLGQNVNWLVGAPYFKGSNSEGVTETYAGGRWSANSNILVFEADEYAVCPPFDRTPKILLYKPTHIICTNVDFDHPDIYRDLAHVESVFAKFFESTKNVFKCESKSVEGNKRGIIDCLKELGHSEISIMEAMRGFQGVARRLESHGQSNGVRYFDDYGHHPAEIVATIEKLRHDCPSSRLILAFQSHTHSRTISLKNEFITALALADIALIDNVFPSAREDSDGARISSSDMEDLAHDMGHKNIFGFESRPHLIDHLVKIRKPGDVILTIGAGDIYKIIDEII